MRTVSNQPPANRGHVKGVGGGFTMVENVNVPLSRLTWAAVKGFNGELI